MKSGDKKLTYEQARELKWFCKNVTGLKLEYYPFLEKLEAFDAKVERLEKTAAMIEEFLLDREVVSGE